MKRTLLSILFLWAVFLFWNTPAGTGAFAINVPQAEVVSGNDNGNYEDLLEVIIATRAADLSLQQTNPWNGQPTFRRTGPYRIAPEKTLAYLSQITRFSTVLAGEDRSSDFREYFTCRRLSGYYIYMLRKIII